MTQIEQLKILLSETETLAQDIKGRIAKLEAETETERFQRVCTELADEFRK